MNERLGAIAAYWNESAPAFDLEPDHGLSAEPTRLAWRRRIADWLPEEPSDVLDAGCGTGSLSLLVAAAGHRVTGVDLAERMVEQARAKLAAAGQPGRFLVGDAAQPPVGEQRFDVLLCRHLLWTLPDPQAALRRWTSLLRPGGRLVLVEGRWREAGAPVEPYTPGAVDLPWAGGVRADDLAAALRPLVRDLRVEPLEADEDLWGGPVRDERYALLARI
ncbi:class I SAM-dependent methyltransferase [Streptomyces sp. TLI_171]|uniref:class I SAM-dependent methyltransferase n=1 Tax=Streptomyces sp. TLI_171 TaxID=1938859 RepID=UPI000C19A2EC|nr:class I SAM-dependent methyltransferase [Streptomyces sp. TLI_171]RKE17675.1 methyltransferase family protein [Streptomyces sp. TLI_171]